MTVTRVPLFDLWPVNRGGAHALLGGFDLDDLVRTGEFTGGDEVPRFEDAFATFCAQGECVGVSSGLDALRLALLALDVGPGDEVIVPALTFVATLEAVEQTGATPVLVDVGPDGLMDPAAADSAVTGRTRVVLPVHLWGQLADNLKLRQVAFDADARYLEDACQAHGARRDDAGVGEFADAAAYSFYPTKPLGAWGDAGAVVTSSGYLATRVRRSREHGQTRRGGPHLTIGYTARLDAIQALVLSTKLPELAQHAGSRRVAADYYLQSLEGMGDLELPIVHPDSHPAWHLFVVRTQHPERLARYLAELGVATGQHYRVPAHLEPAYAGLGFRRGRFPVAERLAAHGLSLPLWAGITVEQQGIVIDAVAGYFRGGSVGV